MKRRGIAFLNNPDSHNTGKIAWAVKKDHGFIHISDCSRTVFLDIECDAPEERYPNRNRKGFQNSLYKLNVMLRELQACERALMAQGRKHGYIE